MFWVINNDGPSPEPPPEVAWPAPGFIPFDLLPTSGRWSWSHANVEIHQATVDVTRNDVPVAVTIESRGEFLAPTLVWRVNTSDLASTPRAEDVTFRVTIGDLWLDGEITEVQYTVVAFLPEAAVGS